MKAITHNFEFFRCDLDQDTLFLNASASFNNAYGSALLNTDIKLHEHAILRMKQRGISLKSLALVLMLGERKYKHDGNLYFFGDAANLHIVNEVQLLDKTKNIVVWVQNDTLVVTLYKNRDKIRNIKKNPKFLLKHNRDGLPL